MKSDILSYMNNFGKRQYSKYEFTAIQSSIHYEYKDRKEKGIMINSRCEQGKKDINIRVCQIALERYNIKISIPDVMLYKKCRYIEYQDRTGRCAWGFKDVRKRLGYDTETGFEL